jgi:hypothetical protein
VRRLRDEITDGHQHLQTWIAIASRNTPQLLAAVKEDPGVQRSLVIAIEELGRLIEEPERTLTPEILYHVRRILSGLRRTGSRRARIDASRALAILAELDGKTLHEAAQLLAKVPPRRHPQREEASK